MTLIDDNNDPLDIDPNTNYLAELVGEGKKFKTPEELARGKFLADEYVKILEAKSDDLRKDYEALREQHNAGQNIKELLDQLKQQNTQVALPLQNEVETQPAYRPEDIEAIAERKFEQIQVQREQTANLNKVKAKLKERFGNNREALSKHLDSLGTNEALIETVAKSNPDFVLRSLGLDQPQEQFQAPPRSARTDHFSPTTQKRTWSYYQKMKQEQPKIYNDPKTTVQMHKDAIALGKDFQDGDYNLV